MIDFIRKTLIYFVNPKKKTSWFFYWFLKKILLINSWFFVKNYWFLYFGFGNPGLLLDMMLLSLIIWKKTIWMWWII